MTKAEFHTVVLGIVTADVLPVCRAMQQQITLLQQTQAQLADVIASLEQRISLLESCLLRARGRDD